MKRNLSEHWTIEEAQPKGMLKITVTPPEPIVKPMVLRIKASFLQQVVQDLTEE